VLEYIPNHNNKKEKSDIIKTIPVEIFAITE
jgi:hypothetical protein